MARILVIDDDLNLLQMVRLMLERNGHEVETSHKGAEGIERAGRIQPELAIIDVMMPDLSGYDVVRRLRDDPATARIPIIILTARSQPMDKHMALEAGANAFLSKPVSSQELNDRVRAVVEAGVDYRVHTGLLTEPIPRAAPEPATNNHRRDLDRVPIGAESAAPAPETTRPTPQVPSEPLLPEPKKPILAVVSLRGGSGGTTVAVNLALMLARRGRSVSLVDLSLAGGHIPLHLHLATPQHWGALLDNDGTPEADAVTKLLTVHAQSKVAVLAAPPAPTLTTLTPGTLRGALLTLAENYDHVIVDVPVLTPGSASALKLASAILLVTSDDASAVQTTKQTLGLLPVWGIPPERVSVVLSHVRPVPDIAPETIQKALQQPLAAELPYQPEQIAAIRRGVPLVVADPKGAYAQALAALAPAPEPA